MELTKWAHYLKTVMLNKLENMELIQTYYADCYVLVHDRSKSYVQKFLKFFLKMPTSMTDEYEIPQYSNKPFISFEDYNNLLDYLEKHINETYFLSFKGFCYDDFKLKDKIAQNDEIGNKAQKIFEKHLLCNCFYLRTGELILGVSCPTQEPNLLIETYFFNLLKEFSRSNIGYITYEQIPPLDIERFIEMSEEWKKNNAYT